MSKHYWSCSHGTANNVFQYLDNHNEGFQTFVNLSFGDDLAYEVDVFGIMRACVELIDKGSPEMAKKMCESLAALLYEGDIDYVYGEEYEPSEEHLERVIEDFKTTLDENLKRILDGKRDGEDD